MLQVCHYYLAGTARSRVKSNMHTPCIFLSVSKIIYTLIMCTPKICLFIRIFSTSCCTLFCAPTVIKSSVYCNAQNIINFHVFLVQITAFGFLSVACLMVSKLPRADLEIAPMLVTFFLPPYPDFFNKLNNSYRPIQKLRRISSFLNKRVENQLTIHTATSYHPYIVMHPYYLL